MDSSKISLPYDILDIIWKNYYSQYILPIIQNKMESKLYLRDYGTLPNNAFQVNVVNYNILRIMSGMVVCIFQIRQLCFSVFDFSFIFYFFKN
jgi:hypothetical protein